MTHACVRSRLMTIQLSPLSPEHDAVNELNASPADWKLQASDVPALTLTRLIIKDERCTHCLHAMTMHAILAGAGTTGHWRASIGSHKPDQQRGSECRLQAPGHRS